MVKNFFHKRGFAAFPAFDFEEGRPFSKKRRFVNSRKQNRPFFFTPRTFLSQRGGFL
jgi:hypothetical protein